MPERMGQSQLKTQTTFIHTIVRECEAKFIHQLFDNDHRIRIEPLTDNNISVEFLIPFLNRYKQKQFKKT